MLCYQPEHIPFQPVFNRPVYYLAAHATAFLPPEAARRPYSRDRAIDARTSLAFAGPALSRSYHSYSALIGLFSQTIPTLMVRVVLANQSIHILTSLV
jgi:hypothetical protein